MNEIFEYEAEGIETGKKKDFSPVPEGEYWLEITDVDQRRTQAGDPMINVEFEITRDRVDEYNGRKVWTNITFFRDKTNKGAGIAIHFLHCIGEPYEGKFKVDIMNWIGKQVRAKLIIDTYTGKDGKPKTNNKVKWFMTDLSDAPVNGKVEASTDALEYEVPF